MSTNRRSAAAALALALIALLVPGCHSRLDQPAAAVEEDGDGKGHRIKVELYYESQCPGCRQVRASTCHVNVEEDAYMMISCMKEDAFMTCSLT